MANVFDVAEFFVRVANQNEDDQMTNLKLNKLLYYAQGTVLARTGKLLFSNDIEEWPLGPVVADVYHKYKVCGRNPIESDDEIDRSCFTDREFEALLDVMREFGQYTGSALVSLSHKADTPWSNAIARNQQLLEQEDIKNYFIQHPTPRLIDKISVPRVSTLPSDWYNPEEDEEWEAYL